MNREYHKWHSSNLNREMELLIFGHAGARVIVFPTSNGRFFDWENRNMVQALSHHIDQGWIQLFCVDSVDPESWWNNEIHPKDKANRHLQYHKYIIEEVLPFTLEKNDNPYVIALGASMGGFHAINIAFRFPDKFNRCVGMSGPYDLKQMSGPYPTFSWAYDYYDDNVLECDPVPYIGSRSNGQIDKIKKLDIIFPIGETDPLFGSNAQLSEILSAKGVPHAFRPWNGFAHDWPEWQEMVLHYIGGADTK